MPVIKKIESSVIRLSSKISQIKTMRAVSEGLSSLLAISMVGAMFVLMQFIPIPPFQAFLQTSGFGEVCVFINTCTIGLLSIYTVIVIARRYCHIFEIDVTQGVLFSLMAFFIVTPVFTSEEISGFSFQWLGASGLFVAILLTLIICTIYRIIMTRKTGFSLPEGVPEGVRASFGSIPSAILIALLAGIIRCGFAASAYGSIHQFIFTLVQTPLLSFGGSFAGVLFAIFMMQILWLMGVHGGMLVMSIMEPIFLALDSANMVAFANSEILPNIVGKSFIYVYAAIGGAGCTLALNMLMCWRAKSKQFKTLGKMSLVPGILGINEPLIYGTPIMLNPILAIPFVLIPLINTVIAYFLTSIGFLPASSGASTTVFILSGLLAGSWKIILASIGFLVLAIIIYYPFFKIIDRRSYEQEQGVTK